MKLLIVVLIFQLIKVPKHSRRNKRQTSKKKRNFSPFLESTKESNRFCSIQMLYVDFNDLKWKVSIS